MADEREEEEQHVGRGRSPGSRAALRANAIKPGQCLNPKGVNGWKKAQARIQKFMAELANPGKSEETRLERLMLAAYTSALMPGPKGAPDRRLLIEQCAGKARQQVDDDDPAVKVGGVFVIPSTPATISAWQEAIGALARPKDTEEPPGDGTQGPPKVVRR